MNKSAKLIIALAAGALGAGIIWLYTTRSGKKVRREASYLAQIARNRLDKARIEMQRSINDFILELSDAIEKGKDSAKGLSQKAKEEVLELLEEGRRYLEEEKARIQKMIG